MTGVARRVFRRPRLESDLWRGYLSVAITVVGTFVGTIIVARADGGAGSDARYSYVVLFGGWALLSIVHSALTVAVFLRLSPERLREVLVATTPRSRWAKVVWTVSGGGATYWASSGAGFAVIGLVALVANRGLADDVLSLALGIGVVVGSLALIIVSYAVRYAREDATAGGAEFPGAAVIPRFSDYVYLAVQVATTFGASDVQITTRPFRRIVATNSLISFAFNSVVVALLVSTILAQAG